MLNASTPKVNKPYSLLYSLITLIFMCPVYAEDEKYPIITEPNWFNNNFLEKQRSQIDELTRRHFGARIRGNRSDFFNLQRLIDRELVAKDDTPALQSLGVALGDIFVNEYSQLAWQVYEDELGKSNAVCIKNTQHCLFPITMLSRRMEVGLKPKVKKIYEKGERSILPLLPKLPFRKTKK